MRALEGFPVTSLVGWLDSSVALHWIRGEGEYKTFVSNRVCKICEHGDVTWRHVPTKENPADVASHGGVINEENQLWWKEPNWLSKCEEWPPDIKTTASAESDEEVKLTKQLFALAKDEDDEFGRFLSKQSDNSSTFVVVAKWVKNVKQDERLQDYLSRNGITWQFNLCWALWWGGQFERMVGLVKAAFYKLIGNGQLRWKELEAVLLNVETTLNDRPLGYVEEDVQSTVITPNSLLFLRPNQLLEPSHHLIENGDLQKRYKYLQKCKDAVWRRWSTEYLQSLRERYLAKKKGGRGVPAVREVVIIQLEQKNRGVWTLGVITELIMGRDGVG